MEGENINQSTHQEETKDLKYAIEKAKEDYIKLMNQPREDNIVDDSGMIKNPSNKEGINPNQNIDRVVTSRGSVFSYLEDGKTQRFKTVTKELNYPQDILVYIPPYESLMQRDYWSKYLKENNITSFEDYESKLLQYTKTGKTILVTNEYGDELKDNQSIYELKKEGKMAFIQLIDKSNGKNNMDFYFPVSSTPKIGWLTFDNRRYINEESGKWLHEKHIGNSVIEIHEKNN